MGLNTGNRQEGLFQRGRAKGKGLAGHNIPDRPSPIIPVPLGILLSAGTEAPEYSLELWRKKWEGGAAGEATLPPASSEDIPGKELGPKGCGGVLGKTPAGIPLHINFPKLDIPAG